MGEASSSQETEWLNQAQAGDLRAFDQLVLLHQQTVFAVAVRMLGDPEEAKDVAQDAFVRAWRSLAAFRREAKLSTWLVSITMNLCRNRRRWWARRRRVIVASLDDPVRPDEESAGRQAADPAPTPDAVAQHRERQRAAADALQHLEPSERSVIVLRDIQGYTYEEIAHISGCRVGTVKSRLSRARARLHGLLKEPR